MFAPRRILAVVLVSAAAVPAVASAQSAPGAASFSPVGRSLPEIQAALADGRTTSADLVAFYLDRIAANDDAGPAIGAVTTVNPRARATARRLDAARDGKPRGPLYGIPFVVKDNYDVVGMATTGGSVALANNYPSRTATVVRRLQDRGAIVLAKTNMSELAASYGRLGYSSAGGQTRNPFDLLRDASGSSSGTAAAVAADFAPFGLGTDTSGSVRGPASVTGQVGIRPTLGLTSRSGVIPLSLSADTTGPIAHTVADEATVLQAMAGTDRADGATARADRYRVVTRGLATSSLRGARVGVVRAFFGGDPEVDTAVDGAIDLMRTQGASAVQVDLGSRFSTLFSDVLGPVGDAEFASEFEGYLAGAPKGTIRTIEELIAISRSRGVRRSGSPVNPARIGGYVAARDARGRLGGAEYRRITKVVIPQLRRHVARLMVRRGLDALVFPTLSCVASPRYDVKDPAYSCESDDPYTASYVASSTGMPEVTLPVGSDAQGLPIGMSLLGRRYRDASVLRLAAAFERAGGVAPVPATVPR
jgi:amidase